MKFKDYLKVQNNTKKIEEEIKADLTAIFCNSIKEEEVEDKLLVFCHNDSIIINYNGVVSSRVISEIVEYFGQDVTISSHVRLSGFCSHVQDKGVSIAVEHEDGGQYESD